ncbi:hypothetical protein TNCV_4593711 [Trichonephila clavipes]|uniref:RNase H type-1 domain-containing protein n=1 Tax=Trichonephila clavipes TaxID=2585209 RepID=A0A8X6WFY3_TRICX|nr:hypothetical protein TNCV_4593711 [Trichonephila clavipes]
MVGFFLWKRSSHVHSAAAHRGERCVAHLGPPPQLLEPEKPIPAERQDAIREAMTVAPDPRAEGEPREICLDPSLGNRGAREDDALNLFGTDEQVPNQPQNHPIYRQNHHKKRSCTLQWIPAHVNILGNEKVDELAKESRACP